LHYFFLDASALAKRYAPEVGTPLINHLFARVTPDRFLVFNVGVAEVVSLLVRKRNGGRITPAACSQALLDLGSEIVHSPTLRKTGADETLVFAAVPLIIRHGINATDAILLRIALDAAIPMRSAGDDLVLVASDQRLLRAAQAERLQTFSPETQSQADLDALIGP
jgi:predicted nucleic acid-binding protein